MGRRLVVDVTEFNTWSGHLTGVQRVVYGFARAVSTSSDDTKYITYQPGGTFREVNYAFVGDRVESTSTASAPLAASTDSVKATLKKVYQKLPVSIRAKLTPDRKEKLKSQLRRARLRAGNMKRRITNLATPSTPDTPVVQFSFKSSDVIVSAGRAWDDDTYIATLEKIRREKGVKVACVVYDLIPIFQQHTFGPGLTERYSRYLYSILKNSDYLLPISRATKKDLLRYANELGIYNLPRIDVVRLGDDIAESVSKERPWFIGESDRFAMIVGTIEARKNHTQLYYAYKLATQQGVDLPKLFIIGKPGWLTHDVLYFIEHDDDVNQKIKVINSVTDKDLSWMYSNALYTVYTSQYEGWGLPIAESMAYGTPCIASNTSSMVEIAPGLVDAVSPFDTAQLLERMAYYSDVNNSMKKRREILKAYTPYTWERTVETLKKLN